MIVDSRTAPMEQESSLSRVYSTSETSEDVYTWIQPPITHLALDPVGSTLIDGIYVQTPPQEVIVVSKRGPDSELESQLAAMAADPDIQREIRLIENEFTGTESDGLTDEE